MNKYNIFWWRDMRYGYNFGDEIVPYLYQKMFDINLQTPCKKNGPNVLVSIGSLLWMSNKNIEFWGTGILSLDHEIPQAKKIHAVRGLFSQQKLFENNIDCPSIYGDPSILLPSIYRPHQILKQYKLGIIPHICDYDHVKKIFANDHNILIVDLKTSNIELVINQILSCDKTISSSLHGLIVSIIYKVPTRWIKFSNKLYGDSIKFYDFFSSLDSDVFNLFDYNAFKTKNDKYNPLVYKDVLSIKNLIDKTFEYEMSNINLDSLLNACPIQN